MVTVARHRYAIPNILVEGRLPSRSEQYYYALSICFVPGCDQEEKDDLMDENDEASLILPSEQHRVFRPLSGSHQFMFKTTNA